jgi:hypothetical protein
VSIFHPFQGGNYRDLIVSADHTSQQLRLVIPSLPLAARVQRDRDDTIDLFHFDPWSMAQVLYQQDPQRVRQVLSLLELKAVERCPQNPFVSRNAIYPQLRFHEPDLAKTIGAKDFLPAFAADLTGGRKDKIEQGP